VWSERRDDLLGLACAQEAMVDEDAGEPIADRLRHERRGDRGVDATGEREDRAPFADGAPELGHRLLDERGWRPIAFAAAHAVEEVAEDLGAAWRVHDLGVELHGKAPLAIAHRRQRQPVGGRDAVESGRQPFDRVAVAHPGALARAEALEQTGRVPYLERRRPVLALPFGRDLTAEDVCHEVHPVADAEDGETAVEDLRIDRWRVLLIHARRTARQDHADHPARGELRGGHVVGEDLAVDTRLAHASRDELRVLGAVVEDGDHRSLGPGIGVIAVRVFLSGLRLPSLEALFRRAHLLSIA